MKIYGWLAILMIFFVSCASSPVKRSAGEVLDDAVISNSIKIKYFKDKTVKGFDVNVDTHKGIVSLRGRLDNQAQINRAIEIAEREKGVRDVKSYLYLDNDGYQASIKSQSGKPNEAGKKSEVSQSIKKGNIQESTITN